MGIRVFLYSIVMLSGFALLYTIAFDKPNIANMKKMAQVSFENSTLYQIDNINVKQIVQAKEAKHFYNRDEMSDATIISRINNQKNFTRIVSGKKIIKLGNILTLQGDVMINSDNKYILNTPYLRYNTQTQIANNDDPFSIDYKKYNLKGTRLHFDLKNNIMGANNIDFKFNLEEQ